MTNKIKYILILSVVIVILSIIYLFFQFRNFGAGTLGGFEIRTFPRAVDNGSGWTIEKHVSSSEKKRIEQRFSEEIIYKLEQYTSSKSTKEK